MLFMSSVLISMTESLGTISSLITMPKLDPYPMLPWSSELPYGGHNNCQSPAHATSSTCWGKAKGSFRNCKSGSMRSTQESIYQLIEKTEAVCYDKFSPYYRGLMDGSIFEYHSPGRESHSSVRTSTSVGSSLFLRILGSSCFHTESEFASSSVQKTLGRREPIETSLINAKKKKLDVTSMKDETSSNKKMKEKAPAELAEQMPTTITNFKEEKPKEGRKFNWADKYQPKTLRDFICHQDKAYMLQSLTREAIKDLKLERGPSQHPNKCENVFMPHRGQSIRTKTMPHSSCHHGTD